MLFPAIRPAYMVIRCMKRRRYPPKRFSNFSSNTLLQEIRLVFFSPSDAETFLKNHASQNKTGKRQK